MASRKIRITRRPSESAQFGIAHPLVALATLSFDAVFRCAAQGPIQLSRQPAITLARQNRLIIHHIIDLPSEIARRSPEETARPQYRHDDLVNEAIVALGSSTRFACKNFRSKNERPGP